jgi:hypothetical protein
MVLDHAKKNMHARLTAWIAAMFDIGKRHPGRFVDMQRNPAADRGAISPT